MSSTGAEKHQLNFSSVRFSLTAGSGALLLGFYWLHASPVVVMFTGLWYDGLYLLFKDLLSVFTHRFVSTRFISGAEMCAATKNPPKNMTSFFILKKFLKNNDIKT